MFWKVRAMPALATSCTGGLVGLACQLKSAAVGVYKPVITLKNVVLPGAVGADQAIDLTALDGDANIGEGLQAAEALGDTCNLEHHIVGFSAMF